MSEMTIFNSDGELIPITREGCAEVMLLRDENERLKAAVDAQAAYIATPFSEEATRMGSALAALEGKS